MKRFVTSDQPYLLLGWAAARLGLSRIWPPESTPIAVVDGAGIIHAVVIYNAFYDDACHIHIATANTKRWATRETLAQIFGHAFVVRGLSRLNAEIQVGNIAAQVMALKLGFRIEGVKRSARDGKDAVCFGMLKNECRWIPAQTATPKEQDAHSHQTNEASHGKEIGAVA